MNMGDRRIINVFKSFIEKVFVPQLAKMDLSCQQQWNKFSNMITSQQLNLSEVQLYVDTLPSTVSSFGAMNSFNTLNNSNALNNINGMNFNKPNDRSENKSPIFSKLRKDSTNEGATGNTGSFNPSRTFGGQRARMMFPLKDFQQPQQDRSSQNFSKDFSKNKQDAESGFSTQVFLPTIQRLFKVFSDNQNKLQKLGAPSQGPYQQKVFYN